MSNHTHVSELLPAFALGCLEPDEALLVAEHVAACALCRAELSEYEAIGGQLALAVPEFDPPHRLRQRLMDRVQPYPVVLGDTRVRRQRWGSSLLNRVGPIWGWASLVLVIALAVGNLLLWQRVSQLTRTVTAEGMRVFMLMETDVAPGATGVVVVSPDGTDGALVVDGLPALDETRQYQLWLIRDGRRTSGGVFSVDPAGYGVLHVDSPAPLAAYDGFGVTIEPHGGSPEPTGAKVLGGSV
jgi:anti-sigma-K factor RskA